MMMMMMMMFSDVDRRISTDNCEFPALAISLWVLKISILSTNFSKTGFYNSKYNII